MMGDSSLNSGSIIYLSELATILGCNIRTIKKALSGTSIELKKTGNLLFLDRHKAANWIFNNRYPTKWQLANSNKIMVEPVSRVSTLNGYTYFFYVHSSGCLEGAILEVRTLSSAESSNIDLIEILSVLRKEISLKESIETSLITINEGQAVFEELTPPLEL